MSASDVVSADDVDSTDVLVSNAAESRSYLEAGDLESAFSGLTQRLVAALSALMVDFDSAEKDPWILLDILLGRLNRSGRADEAWLIFIALTTVLPRVADVEAFLREATSSSVAQTRLWLFAFTLPIIRERGTMNLPMRVVQDATVIDVNFSATDEHNTGIQRVVRRTLPSWLRDHAVELAAWTSYSGALRTLTPREFHRAVEWDAVREGDKDASNVELLVPWRTRLILAEVPSRSSMCDPLGALARFSGNSVSLIGYDAIPIVSAESVPAGMSDHFAKFLGVVKWSESVAAISAAAAGEFRGFVAMLGSQGLVGPRVVECSLPADPVREVVVVPRSRPLVAVVGSKEPRKNHVAVLFAAERLWRAGHDFELLFIGSYGWDTHRFRVWLNRLQKAGRPVSAPVKVGDDGLWRAYAEARFTVFPSLHEGYGLPVAESLAYGTPVITTWYGSTGEIAADGGCVVVDPRDDDQIFAAMELLLTDDSQIDRLKAEALARPVKTWDQYAAEVWNTIGTPE